MNKSMLKRYPALLLLLAVGGIAPAQAEMQDDAQRLGVATCASSTCHGRVSPAPNSYAQLNEYFLWSKYDRHAQAFHTLKNAWSQRIANNMGLKDATSAPECLVCHSDYVPEAERGPRFRVTDGIGCEACHGSASGYIDAHYGPTASHAKNIELGLAPTEHPRVQAQLCQSCHVGDETRLVTHEIMAAGHPRLRFELDTWLTNMPPHHTEDGDYAERKGITSGSHRWAIGMATAATGYVDMLGKHINHGDMVPQLGLFDCHACHRPMDTGVQRSSADKRTATAGSLRPNDYAIRTVEVITGLRDKALAQRIERENRALHKSMTQSNGSFKSRVKALKESLRLAQAVIASQPLSASERTVVRKSLLQTASQGHFRDYADAEQLFLALQVLAEDGTGGAGGEYDRLFQLLGNERNFRPATVAAEARSILR